jgi:hypothetical protein
MNAVLLCMVLQRNLLSLALPISKLKGLYGPRVILHRDCGRLINAILLCSSGNTFHCYNYAYRTLLEDVSEGSSNEHTFARILVLRNRVARGADPLLSALAKGCILLHLTLSTDNTSNFETFLSFDHNKLSSSHILHLSICTKHFYLLLFFFIVVLALDYGRGL